MAAQLTQAHHCLHQKKEVHNSNKTFTFQLLVLGISHPLKLFTMKIFMLLPLLSMGMLPANKSSVTVEKNSAPQNYLSLVSNNNQQPGTPTETGDCRMPAIVFKSQEYCRAELKDFEFDAHFTVTGATVYFSGTNFKNPEKAFIVSNSLKPIKPLMDRCAPGSVITFDDVKVVGPDKEKRTIPGITIVLY
jgi:hypothetical protein